MEKWRDFIYLSPFARIFPKIARPMQTVPLTTHKLFPILLILEPPTASNSI